MKPDTPKFAGPACAHKRVAAFTEEKNGVVYREYWACEDCRREFVQKTGSDGESLSYHQQYLTLSDKEYQQWLGGGQIIDGLLISAAPKPDCVGVEEIKIKILRDMAAEGYDVGFVANKAIERFIVAVGLLAVKEKAQDEECKSRKS